MQIECSPQALGELPVKSSVKLNVSGPKKQRPINSTEPDVPKRMGLVKSVWNVLVFIFKMKTF